ncbi:MAG: hypothetical protein VKL58_03290, partial [Cyanobacteriota bacterium]|nr:hypothetical protein [Cyanobacteriota bacterium]
PAPPRRLPAASRLVPPATPSSPEPPSGGEEPLVPPESEPLPPSSPIVDALGLGPLDLDQLGLTEAIGGLALGLIALFSSYDHINLGELTLHIEQQWGIPFIAASVAIVFIDAELASRSRLRAARDAVRAAQDRARMADETARERYLASEERDRADQERNRAAEARERQAENDQRQNADLALLRRSALLSTRVQLDPTASNRARLQTFLALISDRFPPEDGGL